MWLLSSILFVWLLAWLRAKWRTQLSQVLLNHVFSALHTTLKRHEWPLTKLYISWDWDREDIIYSKPSSDLNYLHNYQKALQRSPSDFLRITLKWSVIIMFEADLNLRGGPKHKLAFTGVFTVKKHNWMLFGGISVQLVSLTIYYRCRDKRSCQCLLSWYNFETSLGVLYKRCDLSRQENDNSSLGLCYWL